MTESAGEIPPEIAAFYGEGKEAGRLFQGLGLVEFARMQELFSRYLPPAPSTVADVGGGPGAYACWLARRGHRVHLLDPVPLHVTQAEQASLSQPDHPLASCSVGDARSLSLADGRVDAVLIHGPLYHLTERRDRLSALREAHRILRPDGVLLAGAITVTASTIVGLTRGWVWDEAYLKMIREEITTGLHHRPPNWNVLTTAFFHRPRELAREVTEAGFQHVDTLGIEGPVWLAQDFEQSWQEEPKREVLLQIARLLEHEPMHSPHILAVARTPRQP